MRDSGATALPNGGASVSLRALIDVLGNRVRKSSNVRRFTSRLRGLFTKKS